MWCTGLNEKAPPPAQPIMEGSLRVRTKLAQDKPRKKLNPGEATVFNMDEQCRAKSTQKRYSNKSIRENMTN
jgi:hypothetical protein